MSGRELTNRLAGLEDPQAGLFVEDLSDEVYHGDPCPSPSISSTMMKTLVKPGGAALVRYRMNAVRAESTVFDFGHAAHSRVLGRGQPIIVLDFPAWTTKAARDARQEAYDTGLVPLLAKDTVLIDGMEAALLTHPVAADLLTQAAGNPELSMFCTDPVTGAWMRGRIDLLVDRKRVVDYKTTVAADPETFARNALKYGYHIQAAHYLAMGIQIGLLDEDATFTLIVQEKEAPHLPAVYTFDELFLELGYTQRARALAEWDRCLTLDTWPGYPDHTQTLTLPNWATKTLYEED